MESRPDKDGYKSAHLTLSLFPHLPPRLRDVAPYLKMTSAIDEKGV